MTKLAERTDIPTHAGWINLTEAAERLGYTRSYIYKIAADFTTIERIGTQAVFIVRESEVNKMVAAKKKSAEKKLLVPADPKPPRERKPRAVKPVADKAEAVAELAANGVDEPEQVLASIEEGLEQSAAGDVHELDLDSIIADLV